MKGARGALVVLAYILLALGVAKAQVPDLHGPARAGCDSKWLSLQRPASEYQSYIESCMRDGNEPASSASGPPAGYAIEPGYTEKSPDGAIAIEQYHYENKDTDEYKWQFWVRGAGAFALLDPEPADYPAGFRFTSDLQWLVRMQKTGSGEATLYLYRRTPQGFVAATKTPLGDLAWAYFKTRPEWRKLKRAPEYHMSVGLLKGTEENYRSLGVDWPANRYLVIGLSGDADVKGRKPMQTSVVHGWRCRYDLQTGKFDVPPLFSDDNANAIVPR